MRRILVIDDESNLRSALVAILRRHDFDVMEAASAEIGLGLVRRNPPDLIISDICMDGLDGFGLVGRLKDDSSTASIPVILMTGRPDLASFGEVRRGMEMGADDYLIKPFAAETLVAAVNARLQRHQSVQRAADQARRRVHAILEATPDLVVMTDRSGQIVYLNEAARAFLGLASPECPQAPLNLCDIHCEPDSDTVRQEGIPTACREDLWRGEAALAGQHGRIMMVSEILLAHRDSDGEPEFLSLIAHDITERRQGEAALRQSEERFRLIAENAEDLLVVVDLDFRVRYVSPAITRLLDRTVESTLGSEVLAQAHPEDRQAAVGKLHELVRSGRGQEFECRLAHGDGSWRTFEFHSGIMHSRSGNAEGFLLMARDVTERKRAEVEHQRMEVQLRHAQKLEAIGQLAAGIAHEINTPTQYIGDNTRFLKDSFADLASLLTTYHQLLETAKPTASLAAAVRAVEDQASAVDVAYLLEEVPRAIDQTLQGVERVAEIVHAMKEFSHPGNEEKTKINLNTALDSTSTVARNEWKYVADLETKFDPNLPLVPCLPGEINQVFLNLIVNAAHAIGDVIGDGSQGKGQISITTRQEGDMVEVRIADTGTGIPEAIRDRIFDPFFTTKAPGKGTGQGLAIAHAVVVEKHKGTIHFESETGRGTTFVIRLPLSPPAKPQEVVP